MTYSSSHWLPVQLILVCATICDNKRWIISQKWIYTSGPIRLYQIASYRIRSWSSPSWHYRDVRSNPPVLQESTTTNFHITFTAGYYCMKISKYNIIQGISNIVFYCYIMMEFLSICHRELMVNQFWGGVSGSYPIQFWALKPFTWQSHL